MATKFLSYFNSIRAGYLFHPERIRCPRLSHSKRNIQTETKCLEFIKKRARDFKIITGVILGFFLLYYFDEESMRRRSVKNGHIRNSCNFIADVVDAAADAVVQILVPEKISFKQGMRGGSGFIIQSDGLIITNAHVVANKCGENVNVILRNGRTFHGVVTDTDEVTDLAMVQINGKNLPVLKFGSANTLRVGEWVIAIGSPLFLSHTVTAGVVSSVHRRAAEIGIQHQNINYIQTDTTVAMGNSGGPLVNLDGEVVGVNTMTLSPGISFAIPAEYVKKFVEHYTHKSNKGTIRYYIGFSYLPLNPATMDQIRSIVTLPNHIKHGMYVWKVEPNSPAFACGLQSGDVIFEVEDDIVYDVKSVMDKVKTKSTVSIKFYRKGIYFKTNLTPKKRF